MSLSMPPNAARNWGKKYQLHLGEEVLRHLNRKEHIRWALRRDGIAAARRRFRVCFIAACGQWALSAQRQSFYSAGSVVRLVFMFSTDNAGAPPSHHLRVFCLFVFVAQPWPPTLPPPHPTKLLRHFQKNLCPPEVSDFPSERTQFTALLSRDV